MSAKFSFFLICCFFIFSCNTAKECDCEKDCQTATPTVLTPENSISNESLYVMYLTHEKAKITKQLQSPDAGQLSEEEVEKLKQALTYANKYIAQLRPKVGGGICPPCPEGICCSDYEYLRVDKKFDKVKVKTDDSENTITLGDQIIIPLRDINNQTVLINSITLSVKDFQGENVELNVDIK